MHPRQDSYDSYGYQQQRGPSPMHHQSHGGMAVPLRQGYPPIHVPPVKPFPPDPFIDQFPLPEALRIGTLFRWLYDPYVDPYRG